MSESLRLVQITDLHYCQEPGGLLDSSIVTDHTLDVVLDRIAELKPHWMVATGDLAQDPEPTTYQRLGRALSRCPFEVYPLPGNHDDPALLASLLSPRGGGAVKRVSKGRWQLLMLDGTWEGQQSGRLPAEELRWLDDTLCAHPDEHALVCLHHHPLPVGSPWMDRIALSNAHELLECLGRHPQVRGVVFGHIHQEFETEWRGIRYFGTPSTCVQFRPNSRELVIDSTPPAFRHFELHLDGRIESAVEYLPDWEMRAISG